jgi:hypothetical protein
MHSRIAILFATLLAAPAAAQTAPVANVCTAPEYRQLDFWVGDWEARFDDGIGGTATGSNVVTRILGDCAIEEKFDGHPGVPLIGRSLSIWDVQIRAWRQTWVDDKGGVFLLTGGPAGKEFVLATAPFGEGGNTRLRMVFTDIAADSFAWLWQKTEDGGQTWKTNWRIDYRRRAK